MLLLGGEVAELSLLNLLLKGLGLLAALGHAVDSDSLLHHLLGLVAGIAPFDLVQSEADLAGVLRVLEGTLLELDVASLLLTLLLELASLFTVLLLFRRAGLAGRGGGFAGFLGALRFLSR